MADNVEQRLEKLEKVIKAQQLEIERSQAARICENMFNRYEYYHVNEQHDKVIAMFAKRPDTRLYFGELGYWEGPDAAKRGWGILKQMKPKPGTMHFHPTMCPVVEVAADGQTAQGVWTTFGFESGADRKTGELDPKYAWGTYGIDFIKEDGEWKFWHFHIYRLLMHTVGKPWTDKKYWNPFPEASGDVDGMPMPEELKPDFPGVDDSPYQIDKVTVIKPEPPLPYKTISKAKWS